MPGQNCRMTIPPALNTSASARPRRTLTPGTRPQSRQRNDAPLRLDSELPYNAQTAREHRRVGFLKLNRLVELAALGAAGAVHVGVVGIDQAAFAAPEHAVFRVRRAETPPPEFRKNPHRAQRAQRQRHINHQQIRDVHGALVAVTGTVCQVKIISPNISRGAGANRRLRASCKAIWSAAALALDSNITVESLPAMSTSACTLLGAITSLTGIDGSSMRVSNRRRDSSPEICIVVACGMASSNVMTGSLNFGSGLKLNGISAGGFVRMNSRKAAPNCSGTGSR